MSSNLAFGLESLESMKENLSENLSWSKSEVASYENKLKDSKAKVSRYESELTSLEETIKTVRDAMVPEPVEPEDIHVEESTNG